MASKSQNMFHKDKTQETTETVHATCHPFVNACPADPPTLAYLDKQLFIIHYVCWCVRRVRMETLEDVAAASSDAQEVATFDSIKTEITMLMEVINGIPEFDGHSIDLQEFTFPMLAAHAQLMAGSSVLGEVRVRNLYNMLVRRVSAGARVDVGITFMTSFAHRLDSALRTLKERAVEEWGATEAEPKIAPYEEVAREALMAEMPDKIQRQLRDGTQPSLEAAHVLDDDEDDVRAAREERQWAIVEAEDLRCGDCPSEDVFGGEGVNLSIEGVHRFRMAVARREERLTIAGLVHTDAARASGWLGTVTPCNCEATTVAGVTAMGGELVLDLEPISGLKSTVKAHVLDWGPQTYQVILGADALRSLGARVTTGSGGWRVKVGNRRFSSVVVLGGADYVGAAVVRSPDAVNPQNIREKFRGVFYVKGDPLPATGRVMHHIDLHSDRPVYVKPLLYGWYRSLPRVTHRYRVVVDFRELNKRTRTERYPLPRLEEMLYRMNGAKVFSILDLKAGYHQIRIHPRDVENTVFQFEREK
ncbi:hypothetical protein AAG570_002103 [Ranatra chinensis]|uniref:Uncharacterized protein n=1 Tax=Ranatra chinensis TaxID=642074 RepID=A0ABD0Y6K4_9HEMI